MEKTKINAEFNDICYNFLLPEIHRSFYSLYKAMRESGMNEPELIRLKAEELETLLVKSVQLNSTMI